jgi:hypothetical protein
VGEEARFCRPKRTNLLRLLIFERTAAAGAGPAGLEIQVGLRRHGGAPSAASVERSRENEGSAWCCCCLTAARGARLMSSTGLYSGRGLHHVPRGELRLELAPCLDHLKIPSFFTLSLSHQFLAACMEY